MDEILTLNDGTEIDGYGIEANGRLFLYMREISLKEAFDLLIEPEKTEEIRGVRYGQEMTFAGYDHLCAISEETGGMISASLKKG